MASCDELFQRKLELDLKRQQNDAALTRINQIQASRELPPDEQFRAAQQDAQAAMADPANRAAADEAIEQQKANPKRVTPRVNINEGQPVNFKQQLRDSPEDVVREYAVMTNSLRQAGMKNMPDEFKAGGYGSPRQQARMLQDLSSRGSVGGWLRVMSESSDRFTGLTNDVAVLRFAHDTAKDVYASGTRELLEFVRDNPGAAVPTEMKTKLFRQFKVALMAQRHYDFVRTSWGRIGQALQGKGYEGPLMEFTDPDLIDAVNGVRDALDEAPVQDVVQDVVQMTPKDLTPEQSFSEILTAIDNVQTNPENAVQQLSFVITNIMIEGAEPQMLNPRQIRYNRLKRFNLLTKDWQLFNESTNWLNLGSNQIMGLFGPYRKFYEDMMEFRETQGTSITRSTNQAWQANWNGLGAAALAMRDAGKEVFMDAFADGKVMYGNNVDTYGKRYQSPDELVQELEDMNASAGGSWRGAFGGVEGKGVPRRLASMANPERYGRYLHTATRLWMYEKTGNSFWLRPGLRTMSAVDNVAGFTYSVYKIRHDLEMEARMQGRQMNFEDADDPQRAMNEWIDEKFMESFYSMEPTEAQRIAFRREQGIPPELLDDQRIDDMIMEQRVSERYGGMVPSPRTREASQFSDEMRFANIPGEEGSTTRQLYMAGKQLQQIPFVESWAPYFQAPFLGTGFDVAMTGFPDIAKLALTDASPAKRRRMKANLIMAGHVFGMWGLLSAGGLVVGNGPTDPLQRREWRTKLKQRGLEPNSIAGVQMRGGFPIINTVFMLQDIHDSKEFAEFSKYDQLGLVEAIAGTLLGYLSRGSAIGQVQQLMDIAYSNRGVGAKVGSFAGYMAAGRYTPSGPMRSLERLSNSQKGDLYMDEDWNEQDFEDIPSDQMEIWERRIRQAAYNVTGLAGAFGGKYKDKDWLGTEIRKPWGMDLMTYLKHRFTPVDHPKDKVYTELDRLDLLDAPEELFTRRLNDVPMTDDMQKYWNDTYGALKGTTDPMLIDGISANLTVRVPLMNIKTPSGIRLKEDLTLMQLDLRAFLGKHVKGKTMLEAARSLMNDPIYQSMEAADATSFGTDAPRTERRQAPARQMMYALKRYYAHMTTTKMETMENPPPEVARWREMNEQKNATLQLESLLESGRRPLMEQTEAQMEAINNAFGGAQ